MFYSLLQFLAVFPHLLLMLPLKSFETLNVILGSTNKVSVCSVHSFQQSCKWQRLSRKVNEGSPSGKEIEFRIEGANWKQTGDSPPHNTNTHTHTNQWQQTCVNHKSAEPAANSSALDFKFIHRASLLSSCSLHTDAFETFVRERDWCECRRREGRRDTMFTGERQRETIKETDRQTDRGSVPAAAEWWIYLFFFLMALTNLQPRSTQQWPQKPPSSPLSLPFILFVCTLEAHAALSFNQVSFRCVCSAALSSSPTCVCVHLDCADV